MGTRNTNRLIIILALCANSYAIGVNTDSLHRLGQNGTGIVFTTNKTTIRDTTVLSRVPSASGRDTIAYIDSGKIKKASKCSETYPAQYHLHSLVTLPDSLKHKVTPLHIPVAKDSVHWKSTSAKIDTVYGDVFFERNFYLGDTTTGLLSLYMGALGTYSDVNLDRTTLYLSTYGGGISARGAYLTMGGNESANGGFSLIAGDSGDGLIASQWNKKSVISGGRLDFNLTYEGSSSINDGLTLMWSNVGHGGLHLFCRDTSKYVSISQGFTVGSKVDLYRHKLDMTGDTLTATFEDLVHFVVPEFWTGSTDRHTKIDSNTVSSDTLHAGVSVIVNGSSKTIATTEEIPDDALDSLFEIYLPVGDHVSGTLSYCMGVSSGTSRHVHSGNVTFGAVNENGVITGDIDEVYLPSNETSIGSGTMTDTWSIIAGTNKVIIRISSNSSLSAPTLHIHCYVTIHSLNAITPL